MKTLAYRIHLEPEPEGGFTVTVPALPPCVTWGRDFHHAVEMAQDAIRCHLESLVKEGLPIPTEAEPDQAMDAVVRVQTAMIA